MINPIQTFISCLLVVLLGFTHIQAFRLGRASVDNFFTRWWKGQTEETRAEQCPQPDEKEPWFENLLD